MTYNTTFLSNSTGIWSLTTGLNDSGGGTLFATMLIFIWLLFLLFFRKNGFPNAFVGSTFVVSIISGLGFGAGLLSGYLLVFPVSFLVLGLVFKLWTDG